MQTKRTLFITLLMFVPSATLACICLPFFYPLQSPPNLFPPTASSVPPPAPPTPTRASGDSCGNLLVQVLNLAESDDFNESGWEGDGGEYDLVIYRVQGEQIVSPHNFPVPEHLRPYQQDADSHQRIWDAFTAIIPSDQRTLFTRFVVFSDGHGNLLGAAEQVDTQPEAWTLEMDVLDAADRNELTDVLVHEYGHMLTLNLSQVSVDPNTSGVCSGYEPDGDCALPNSYLNQFFNRFWSNLYADWQSIDIIEDQSTYESRLYNFYRKHEDQFVTEYAATSPDEDIAESWLYFVFMPKPESNSIADQKILFFYDYPELVALRSAISERLCIYLTTP